MKKMLVAWTNESDIRNWEGIHSGEDMLFKQLLRDVFANTYMNGTEYICKWLPRYDSWIDFFADLSLRPPERCSTLTPYNVKGAIAYNFDTVIALDDYNRSLHIWAIEYEEKPHVDPTDHFVTEWFATREGVNARYRRVYTLSFDICKMAMKGRDEIFPLDCDLIERYIMDSIEGENGVETEYTLRFKSKASPDEVKVFANGIHLFNATNVEVSYTSKPSLFGTHVYEWCPQCNREVELLNDYSIQTCPSCHQPILPCSLCPRTDGDSKCIEECPLVAEKSAIVN